MTIRSSAAKKRDRKAKTIGFVRKIAVLDKLPFGSYILCKLEWQNEYPDLDKAVLLSLQRVQQGFE